jgi:hypothetical protein
LSGCSTQNNNENQVLNNGVNTVSIIDINLHPELYIGKTVKIKAEFSTNTSEPYAEFIQLYDTDGDGIFEHMSTIFVKTINVSKPEPFLTDTEYNFTGVVLNESNRLFLSVTKIETP